ncbi:unnamed protein product [Alopecurus aequalis]
MGNINSCWDTEPAETPPTDNETSSICLTKPQRGAHNFMIANYSDLKGMGVGRFVSSRPFSVGGYNWQIMFYPDGADRKHAGYAAAYLRCCSASDDDAAASAAVAASGVRTEYTLSLRVKHGRVHRCSRDSNDRVRYTFPALGAALGFPMFIKRSKLRREYFTIRCDLKVIKHHVL